MKSRRPPGVVCLIVYAKSFASPETDRSAQKRFPPSLAVFIKAVGRHSTAPRPTTLLERAGASKAWSVKEGRRAADVESFS
uniref:Putative secreted protein n=1 Tax=Ixodes ricinus TaxID=34613 RepID=A0A147BLA5_IXORI